MNTLLKFFIVNSFKIFYLIQYYKNTFYEKFFLYVNSILQMESYFPGLVKTQGQILAFGCLESVANKKRCVPKKKQLVKKILIHKINFQLEKVFNFNS